MTTERHPPGPGAWFGNGNPKTIYLSTTYGGRISVMDFTRWGMQGAQPRFHPGHSLGMVPAKDLIKFEVGGLGVTGMDQAVKDGSVYRYDIKSLNCPDAHLIATAPELLEMLEELNSREDHGWPGATKDEVEELIAKAKGEKN